MEASNESPAAPEGGGAYGWYVVGLLTAASLCSYVDRQILSLLIGPIRHDLHISDVQIGILQGVAFGILFTLIGAPLGYIADRVSRRWMLTLGVIAWSAMTAVCALTNTFGQLFLARIGVGIGEATLGPCAVPLIRDLMGKERLARAISFYTLGISAGTGLAAIVGASLLQAFTHAGGVTLPVFGALRPWQATFTVVAAPGVIIGLLMLTIRDPRKVRAQGGPPAPSLGQVGSFVGAHWRTYVGFGLPGIACTVMMFGVGFWIPEVFRRSYGLSPDQVAGYIRMYGLMSMVLGSLGALTGGAIGDYLRRTRADGYPILATCGLVVMAVMYSLFALAPTPQLALTALAPAIFVGMMPPVMAAAAGVELAPQRMRSLVAAVWTPLFTLIGAGFGPVIVAGVNRAVFHQDATLRFAMPIVVLTLTVLAVPLLIAVRGPYRATVAAAEAWVDERLLESLAA